MRSKPRDRQEMVRILCDDIQQHCSSPGRKALSKIAEMVVGKYSKSFRDCVADTVLGTGFESFRKQLEERLYNQNRKVEQSRSLSRKLSPASDNDSGREAKAGQKNMCDSYGCVNWQPDSYPDDETTDSQKEKQGWLTSAFRKKDRDNDKVASYMKLTYASQRLLINRGKPNPPSINEIMDEWPFLFEFDPLMQHFEQLMGFDLKVVLQRSLEEKAKLVYNFMKLEHSHQKKVKEALDKMDAAMETERSNIPQMDGVYLLLLAYFGESGNHMLRCFDVSIYVLIRGV